MRTCSAVVALFVSLGCATSVELEVEPEPYVLGVDLLSASQVQGRPGSFETSIVAAPGTVAPASGRVELFELSADGRIATTRRNVGEDGSFAIAFIAGEREPFRLIVTGQRRPPSDPFDAFYAEGTLMPQPETECIEVVPEVLEFVEERFTIRNGCSFPVTREPASFGDETDAVVQEGPLELQPGEEVEVRVTGLAGRNTLRIPFTNPPDEQRFVSFILPWRGPPPAAP